MILRSMLPDQKVHLSKKKSSKMSLEFDAMAARPMPNTQCSSATVIKFNIDPVEQGRHTHVH